MSDSRLPTPHALLFKRVAYNRRMSNPQTEPDGLGAVPLFPLPNVVLFPKAVQPLHIFEERYKAMTHDALNGDGRIAMALLRPGWEREYYSRPAIEPVVCVGRIISHERLPDGKYNFLLQGEARARVVREHDGHLTPYRAAELDLLPETEAPAEVLTDLRRRLQRLFAHSPLAPTPAGRQFRQLLEGTLPTPLVADLLAFTYLEDVPLKQSLLAERDVGGRVARLVDALEASQPVLQSAYLRVSGDPTMN